MAAVWSAVIPGAATKRHMFLGVSHPWKSAGVSFPPTKKFISTVTTRRQCVAHQNNAHPVRERCAHYAALALREQLTIRKSHQEEKKKQKGSELWIQGSALRGFWKVKVHSHRPLFRMSELLEVLHSQHIQSNRAPLQRQRSPEWVESRMDALVTSSKRRVDAQKRRGTAIKLPVDHRDIDCQLRLIDVNFDSSNVGAPWLAVGIV